MITKKTFAKTTSFLISATLLSQIYSFSSERLHPKSINYSAFTNLAANLNSMSAVERLSPVETPDTVVTAEIVAVIGKEISRKIINTRYAIITPRIKTAKKVALVVPVIKDEVKIQLKIENVASEDLSAYEINNQGLINLYSLSVEQMAYTKFEASDIADIKDEVVVAQASTEENKSEVDEVQMIQRSPERKEVPVTKEVVQEDNKADEEMVMFDYSDKTPVAQTVKNIDQKLYERPLSSTVKNAISREIAIAPIKKLVQPEPKETRIDDKDIDLESEQNIIYDYSNDAVKTTQSSAEQAAAAISAFSAPAKTDQENTQFRIRAKEINLNTHKVRQAHAFEFVPDYERAERTDDQSSGEIALGYSLNGEMNTQTGIIQAQGMITTRVELNLGSAAGIEIPLLNEDGIQQYLHNLGLSIEGNLILIAIDPSIVDTEIDSSFGARLYFDQGFKPLATNVGATYVMYAGVKSGNIMIRYLLANKETSQKIVYVGDGEMYFEDPDFVASQRETYTFTTRNLLGQKRKELIIDGSDITFFNTNVAAKKKALNAYEIKVPTLVSGMRKYLEFKHLKDSIFVGSSNEKDIEIPSNDFIGKVLEMNQVSSLKERCVVQVNLSKDIREIKANGKNKSGEMYVETSFLDNDGNFSRDSERAEKAFIVGDLEGVFNVRLDYTDGSTEFLKTFCSEGTYLVEQL